MSTTTKPLPLFGTADVLPVSGRLRGLLCCGRCQYAPDFNLDTQPILVGDLQGRQRRYECSPAWRVCYAQAAAVAALLALRRAMADDELTRPLELPDLKAVAVCHDLGHLATPFPCQTVPPDGVEEAEPTLDFHWSKARRKVRVAAKAYGEQTHADY